MLQEMLQQASTFEESGRLDLALKIYDVALTLLPTTSTEAAAGILLRRGRLRYRLNNHQGAMDDLRKAIDMAPRLASTLTGEFSRFYKESCH